MIFEMWLIISNNVMSWYTSFFFKGCIITNSSCNSNILGPALVEIALVHCSLK